VEIVSLQQSLYMPFNGVSFIYRPTFVEIEKHLIRPRLHDSNIDPHLHNSLQSPNVRSVVVGMSWF
jgi:hypothetical protein